MDWDDVQGKKNDLLTRIVASLNDDEQDILQKALDLEWENRHMGTWEFRKPLKVYIEQVIK